MARARPVASAGSEQGIASPTGRVTGAVGQQRCLCPSAHLTRATGYVPTECLPRCRAWSPGSQPGQAVSHVGSAESHVGSADCPSAQGPHHVEVMPESAGLWVPPSGGRLPHPGSPGVHCGQVNGQTSLSSQRPLSGWEGEQGLWRRSPLGLDTRRSQERGARPQAREAEALPTSQSGSRADCDRRPPPAALQGGSDQGLQVPHIHPEF